MSWHPPHTPQFHMVSIHGALEGGCDGFWASSRLSCSVFYFSTTIYEESGRQREREVNSAGTANRSIPAFWQVERPTPPFPARNTYTAIMGGVAMATRIILSLKPKKRPNPNVLRLLFRFFSTTFDDTPWNQANLIGPNVKIANKSSFVIKPFCFKSEKKSSVHNSTFPRHTFSRESWIPKLRGSAW
jgi:hypothetical protein